MPSLQLFITGTSLNVIVDFFVVSEAQYTIVWPLWRRNFLLHNNI
jgi:hypothetical protein